MINIEKIDVASSKSFNLTSNFKHFKLIPTYFDETDFACGGSYDWVKGRAGVKYSFTMEIGNDTAGFTVPPRLITKLGMEVYTGLIALLGAIEETDRCWINPQEC